MDISFSSTDPDRLVSELGTPHRAKRAYWRLVLNGSGSIPAVRKGLQSASGDVRMHCARILDHIVDEGSFADLLSLLDDPDPRVRLHTVHALACDRCKENEFCISKDEVLPKAIELLSNDPDKHVRAMAIELVGRWVHSDERAVSAVEAARDGDEAPSVRKKAGWYAPGGTIYRKRMPGAR